MQTLKILLVTLVAIALMFVGAGLGLYGAMTANYAIYCIAIVCFVAAFVAFNSVQTEF